MGPFLAPDVLVLAAGGTVGEAWMTGVLAGIEASAGADLRRVEQVVGTSAGSIVGASLIAGRSPRRPSGAAAGAPSVAPDRSGRAQATLGGLGRAALEGAVAVSSPFAAPALALGAPAGARLRALALARVPGTDRSLAGLAAEADRRGARWDGRLRVCAVEKASGRRVVFGAPGAPDATVGQAVAASCSVPWIFAPVRIGGREYVDGGAWSLTNLDVATVARGTHVLCLDVSASLAVARASAFGAVRVVARSAAAVEELKLRRRGATVRTIGPDGASARVLGDNLMDEARAPDALAAGYRQGLAVGAAA